MNEESSSSVCPRFKTDDFSRFRKKIFFFVFFFQCKVAFSIIPWTCFLSVSAFLVADLRLFKRLCPSDAQYVSSSSTRISSILKLNHRKFEIGENYDVKNCRYFFLSICDALQIIPCKVAEVVISGEQFQKIVSKRNSRAHFPKAIPWSHYQDKMLSWVTVTDSDVW